MTARAASIAATAERILDAALSLWARSPVDQIRLEVLAEQAGVGVPTVVRRFGGKPGVICALVERELERMRAQRVVLAREPVEVIVDYFVDYYERFGRLVLKLYSEAPHVAGLPELAARARAEHLRSVREAFAGHLSGEAGDADRRMAQTIAVLDVTFWRILRDDCGLEPAEVRTALLELVRPLVR